MQKAQEAEDRHALNAAKLLAGRGNIALTQLRYDDAAEHFKQAATLVPSGHPDETADCLHRQADALYRGGNERGNSGAWAGALVEFLNVSERGPATRSGGVRSRLPSSLLTRRWSEGDSNCWSPVK
jgi:hypothetical protein